MYSYNQNAQNVHQQYQTVDFAIIVLCVTSVKTIILYKAIYAKVATNFYLIAKSVRTNRDVKPVNQDIS